MVIIERLRNHIRNRTVWHKGQLDGDPHPSVLRPIAAKVGIPPAKSQQENLPVDRSTTLVM